MTKGTFMWECKCGYTEYGAHPPDDCPECLRVGKFEKVPEELIEEREAERVLSKNFDGGDGEKENED